MKTIRKGLLQRLQSEAGFGPHHEGLVVIGALGILAAIVIPQVQEYRSRALQTAGSAPSLMKCVLVVVGGLAVLAVILQIIAVVIEFIADKFSERRRTSELEIEKRYQARLEDVMAKHSQFWRERLTSKTLVLLPIANGLKRFSAGGWVSSEASRGNRLQNLFVEHYLDSWDHGESCPDPDITLCATGSLSEMNSFLCREAFDLHFSNLGPDCLAIAQKTRLHYREWDSVRPSFVENQFGRFEALDVPGNVAMMIGEPATTAGFKAANGDSIFVRIIVPPFEPGKELWELLHREGWPEDRINDSLETGWKATIRIPSIAFRRDGPVEWLAGLETRVSGDKKLRVSHVLEKVDFQLNVGHREGTHCEETEGRKLFVIDVPFMLWVVRRGYSEPIFLGMFGEDSWIRQ